MRAQIVSDLAAFLEATYQRFHNEEHVRNDPLFFPRQYVDPVDQEVVGLIAASLAFGNVKAFMAKCAEILERLGPAPSARLSKMSIHEALEVSKGLRYRFISEAEIASLVLAVGRLLNDHDSLFHFFWQGFGKNGHILSGLQSLQTALVQAVPEGLPGPGFLLPYPCEAHACKRLLLFLRWMVRRDGLDLGLWQAIEPAALIIPMDVHVQRVAVFLGLLRRRKSGPKFQDAIALTNVLRLFDPKDPVRFDFALSHLGISRTCKGRPDPQTCPLCPLSQACVEYHLFNGPIPKQ